VIDSLRSGRHTTFLPRIRNPPLSTLGELAQLLGLPNQIRTQHLRVGLRLHLVRVRFEGRGRTALEFKRLIFAGSNPLKPNAIPSDRAGDVGAE
jgi:hypothetical protein